MRRRGWQRPWSLVAQDFPTCCGTDSLFYSDDDLELLPHCKSDGSFHVVHGWFTVLLTVSLQLLTIVSFGLFFGVTEYYTETFRGVLVLPLTSLPQTQDAWFVFLYHFSQSLFMMLVYFLTLLLRARAHR